jgi:ATP-dependent DNA helicase RecG
VRSLDIPLQQIPVIPSKKAEILAKEAGIRTVGDLLSWYPFRYIDRTRVYTISELQEELPYIQLVGTLESVRTTGQGARQRLSATLRDATGRIELVWFQGIRFIENKLKPGREYLVFGKPTLFNGQWNIAHPELEAYHPDKVAAASRLQAVYSSTDKMKRAGLESKGLGLLIRQMLQVFQDKISDSLPNRLRHDLHLMPLGDAYRFIHFPENAERLDAAVKRLKFEELFFLQLRLIRQNLVNKIQCKGFPFSVVGETFNRFYHEHLPFPLTNAQKKVLREIRHDVGRPIQMNRLVQGDVGSGKTIVAFLSMLIAVDNGFQACLMAPTEILAQQHFAGLKPYAEALGLQMELLTGSVGARKRRTIHEGLENGSLHFLVGTHALLEDKVKFHNLGFVVIDEQHRFGVAQRAKLWAKNSLPPHVLIMSATPIPRTLAMTLYGDLDVSVIDELPPGRKPVKTVHRYDSRRPEVFQFLKSEIEKGRQIYIVYPLIEESEQLDYRNLFEGFEHLQSWFPLPDYQISIVHGRLKADDKDYEMQRFVQGQTHIMVATTVIEVGVNVPNASVMIIESAERFGLSQLHQLRGRVGRGAEQSYCILMTGVKLSADARTRIKTMCETNDGFQIAEVDLRLRGPGDLQGTQQSGDLDLKLADLSRDSGLIGWCRELAFQVLDADPELQLPEHQPLKNKLEELETKYVNWGRIS